VPASTNYCSETILFSITYEGDGLLKLIQVHLLKEKRVKLTSSPSGESNGINDSGTSNEEFVDICYDMFLERKTDPQAKKNAYAFLEKGRSRLELIKSIVTSPEYYNVLTTTLFGETDLPDLRQIRPNSYVFSKIRGTSDRTLTFDVQTPSDSDWLESMIVEHGYYEKPGVWSPAIDTDKRVIAEIISRFNPSCCLEIGCSTGAILKLLRDKDIYSEGIEISHRALALSYPEIRRRIHFGDLLTLNIKTEFDMIIGLDVFEHLNPTKLPFYLKRCQSLLRKNGFLFANIPAFGKDPIFGEVFPIYLEDWSNRSEIPFSLLDVDEKGWPLNGHLIWATAAWWQKMFEAAGFNREVEIEMALHEIYDEYMSIDAQARKSFFIFSRSLESRVLVKDIVDSIFEQRTHPGESEYNKCGST